jgi:UDP-glucose 4-epimerase
VFDVIKAVERALGAPVPHSVGARRAGDPPSLLADISRARDVLGWTPGTPDLDQIVGDAVRWERAPAYGRAQRAR